MTRPNYTQSLLTDELKSEFAGKFWLVHTAHCKEGLLRQITLVDGEIIAESKGKDRATQEPFSHKARISEYGTSPTFTGPFESPFAANNYRQFTREKAS